MKKLALLVCFLLISSTSALAQAIDFCEGNFDFDSDQDAMDAARFKTDFGRSQLCKPCPPDGPARVPSTGQDVCYNSTGASLDCSATGQDGEYRAGVSLPLPRFKDTGNGALTDNLTGLIWLKNADCFGQRRWLQALSDANGLANGACGLSDGSAAGSWRLPNIKELQSLIDYGAFNPAFVQPFFTNLRLSNYWSSTTYEGNTGSAWVVSTVSGNVSSVGKTSGNYYVLPVRGGILSQSPSSATIPYWSHVTVAPFNPTPPVGVYNPVLTAGDVTDMDARFVADPFVFFENGNWFMFFEALDNITNRGSIALATSTDGLHWTYDRTVLSAGWHASYPLVLKVGDNYYMIPDAFAQQAVYVFRAAHFPYNWQYVATIVSGRRFADPTIFWHNDTWWMFIGNEYNNTCYLYYSDNLLSGWVEHPMSPIVANDAGKARPAGRAFVFDNGRVIRLAQKCDVRYGEQVRAFEVDVLTRTDYAEHELAESPLLDKNGSGWNALGMHHFDPWWTGSKWICAVDGLNSNYDWSIGIYLSEN